MVWVVLASGIFLPILGVAIRAESVDASPSLALEKKAEEEGTLQLILVDAPGGMHMFDITVSVRDIHIARIHSPRGIAIAEPYFQVVWVVKTTHEDSIQFRALDSKGDVMPGAQDVVLAEIDVVDLAPGRTQIDMTVNSFVDDSNRSVVPQVSSILYEVRDSPPVSETLPTEPSSERVEDTPPASPRASELPPIGGAAKPPQDLDGDGLYEDIDGDGELTSEDVALFASAIYEDVIQNHPECFAFHDDARVDLEDVRTLASLVLKGSPALTILHLGHGTGETGAEIVLDLTLRQGLRGLQTFYLTVSTRDPTVSEISEVTSMAIHPGFFEVVRHDPGSVTFRAADFMDEIRPGADDVVLAAVVVTGVKAGETVIDIAVEAMTDDEGFPIEPVVQPGEVTIATLLSPIGDSPYRPQDHNNDGLYEDVDGDGRLTYSDALLLVFNLASEVIQDNPGLFDFNADGVVDFDDAGVLALLVEEG